MFVPTNQPSCSITQKTIVLICKDIEYGYLADHIKAINPAISTLHCGTKDDFSKLIKIASAFQLIAFCTDIIIPRNILEISHFTGYNIHPAPPEYPGSHPTSFAIWEHAAKFGVTAHEIAPKVDSGKIVYVKRFAIDPRLDQLTLGDLTYQYAVTAFSVIANHCATSDKTMPSIDVEWGQPKRTKKCFETLCKLGTQLTGEDLSRHHRACGASIELGTD